MPSFVSDDHTYLGMERRSGIYTYIGDLELWYQAPLLFTRQASAVRARDDNMVKSPTLLMAIVTTALAQSTTTTTTANVITTSLFLAATTPATFVASIIGADKSSTIYALNCQDCGDTSTVTVSCSPIQYAVAVDI